jgi:hypothetical protein
MSADNAIYIRHLPNKKFAVKCISSLYHEEMTDEEIDSEFLAEKELDSLDAAYDEAERIDAEWDEKGWHIEYGWEELPRKA